MYQILKMHGIHLYLQEFLVVTRRQTWLPHQTLHEPLTLGPAGGKQPGEGRTGQVVGEGRTGQVAGGSETQAFTSITNLCNTSIYIDNKSM